jgi:hypothetical protein
MNFAFVADINYLAVAVSAIIFFFLGSLWFSALFRKSWVTELGRHNVIIKEPAKNVLFRNMVLTFIANIVASLGMACLVDMTDSTTLESGVLLGLIAALSFAATAVGGIFIWENRSVKLFLIDVGYPFVGIIALGIILSIWR